MAFDLDSITRGGTIRPPRIVLLGTEKIGKSEFAAGADNPIFFPIKGEEGIDALDVARFPTCNYLDDVHKGLLTLWNDDHSFGTVVIDSVSTLEPLIWKRVCADNVTKDGASRPVDSIEKVGGGFQRGYTEAVSEMRKVIEALDALRNKKNMASILIGHVSVSTFNDPEGPSYEQYQFDVHKKMYSMLYRWADLILFANKKTAVKVSEEFGQSKGKGKDFSGNKHFLFTQKRPAHPGGGRGIFGKLPYELDLSWKSFQDAVTEAAKSQCTESG